MTRFSDLALLPPLLRAVSDEGYETPTPIQLQAIPHVLAGRDVLGCAQTGTGKTAAFALPILQGLHLAGVGRASGQRLPRVLVLTPTRELATQIGDGFAAYGRHVGVRHAVIFGGVSQAPQERALRAGLDVLVATPGRLIDLLGQGLVSLERINVLVLDEADRMLDMGFIHDVRRVLAKVPTARQTLLFSATMPADIRSLANDILKSPVTIAVVPPATTAERIDQSVYLVEKADKRALLEHLLRDPAITRALVFTRTKHGANRVVDGLRRVNIAADVIHGNKSQNARERALAHFKDGQVRVLVATDIAGRGIDIESVSHVINFDLPNVAEAYVHRIGRTARAGAAGIAISFCETEERAYLNAIQRLTGVDVPIVADHPYRSSNRAPLNANDRPPPLQQRQQQSHHRPQQQQQSRHRAEVRPRHDGTGQQGGRSPEQTATASSPGGSPRPRGRRGGGGGGGGPSGGTWGPPRRPR